MSAADVFETASQAGAAAEILRKAVADVVPVVSGQLRDSIRVEQSEADGNVRLEVFGALQGRFLITGTRPHSIDAVNARVLTDGTTFFGPHVNHPGTSPNDFRDAALQTAIPAVRALGAEMVRVAAQNIKRRVKNV